MDFEFGRLLPHTSNSQQHRLVLENHTMGYIGLNEMYIDATNRGLTVFRLDDFLDNRQWTKLSHVYLAKNTLLKLPEDLFNHLSNLRWLDLRWNDLSTVPQSIKHHPSLRTLLLQNNKIERLPLELGSLQKLRCLSILNNPLEFPSKNVLSQLRSNKDLIDYLRKCWQEQSTEVPVGKTGNKVKRRRPAKKLAPVKKVKDHTEVICRLRKSGRIKDQVIAQKMLHDLELEQKLVQSFKDQDVLKKWRDKYREAQGSAATSRRARKLPSFTRISETMPQRNQSSEQYLLTRDIDQAISNLNSQLAQSSIVHTSNDHEEVIRRSKREMETVGEIRKKILYLKHHC